VGTLVSTEQRGEVTKGDEREQQGKMRGREVPSHIALAIVRTNEERQAMK
jgi:hypothetical protein